MTSASESTKVALDEGRMLVLVVEVLLGFSFQGTFQPGFNRLSPSAHMANFCVFCLLLIAFALLLSIPAHHRLVEEGRNSVQFIRFTSRTIGVLLLPFALAISLEIFVVGEGLLGTAISLCATAGIFTLAILAWYVVPGLRALSIGSTRKARTAVKDELPPVKERINQVLTECRVVLPGTQALLGFQLIAFLTDAFEKISHELQFLHFGALLSVVVSAILLMLPPAYHRLGEGGRNSHHLLNVSSRCLMGALVFLAIGISADFYIVAFRVWNSAPVAALSAAVALVGFLSAWFGIPLARRFTQDRPGADLRM